MGTNGSKPGLGLAKNSANFFVSTEEDETSCSEEEGEEGDISAGLFDISYSDLGGIVHPEVMSKNKQISLSQFLFKIFALLFLVFSNLLLAGKHCNTLDCHSILTFSMLLSSFRFGGSHSFARESYNPPPENTPY